MNLTKFAYFQFAGRKSNEMNMVIRDEMEFEIPQATLDFQSIDGRSSDIIFNHNRFEDIEKTFPVRLYKKTDSTIASQLRDIAGWLYSSQNYAPLVFSGYSDYYYKALVYKSVSASDVNRAWLDLSLTFKCQAFVFRVDGAEERAIESGSSITNPELFSSLPVISFNKTSASNDSNIYINGNQFRIAKEAGTGVITIDSENGIAYKEGGVNVSKYCLMGGAGYTPIVLEAGRNEISYDNIDQFKIKPNWRALVL